MAKKVAILAVNPVNGNGLFQYLEEFYENGIPYKVFAVATGKEIKTNSGLTLITDDVVANLKGREDEYDALVFGCGNAIPKFKDNISATYNQDLMAVLRAFDNKGKIMVGHCAAGLIFDLAGVAAGKQIAVHPFVKDMVKNAKVTDKKSVIDGNYYTAKTENFIWSIIDDLLEALL